MTTLTMRTRLLASTMITGAAIAAIATGANAQQAAAPITSTNVQELVVTGSRIPQPNLTSIAPVTTVSNQEFKLSGATGVEDLVNQLPQVTAEFGNFEANGGTGTATVSLRNLGSNRTLVLIDGQRLVPGDPTVPVPDLNFIPATLVERVEVDMAGASAVYGADAVAGVVNFIMKKNFTGLSIDANWSVYQHTNGNSALQDDARRAGFFTPTGNVFDGYSQDVTITFGANLPDGKGNVEGYLDYRHIDPVLGLKRDYGACTLGLNSAQTGYNCKGSETNALGSFLVYTPSFTPLAQYTLDTAHPGNFTTNFPSTLFNYGALNYYQQVNERYAAGFFAHYDINDAIRPYGSFMFMRDHAVTQVAPSGFFGNATAFVPCNDPLLSANEAAALCGANAGKAGEVSNPIILLRRNVEGGDRLDDLTHSDYRVNFGVKGDLGQGWHYDIYGLYGESDLTEIFKNDASVARMLQALDVVPGPGGAPVCAVATGGCVPWNIFTPGGVTPAAVNFISGRGFSAGRTTEQVVSGSITGDLGQYGLKSPWAHDGIGIAVGGEYRREFLSDQFDQEFLTGDLSGQGGPKVNVQGSYGVKEVFGEVRIPLIQDMPFFKMLSAELGYRYSDYTQSGGTNAYKITGEWAINDDIRIRGGFNRTVRAPNILELFTPQSIGLDGNTDGCANNPKTGVPDFTPAQCANTGVTPAEYGHIGANPASQYNGLLGGNPHLKPETGSTYSVGAVITPHEFIRGLSVSVDYFNIKITGIIQGFGADNILDTCALTGNPTFCSLIHRAAGSGSLWLGPQVIGNPASGYIIDTIQNGGFLKTSGVDFAVNYRLDLDQAGLKNAGSLALDFLGTYTHDYQVFSGIPGAPVLQCVGKFGTTCQGSSTPQSGPLPSFKAKTRLTWNTPWNAQVSVAWRYTGPVDKDTGATGCADCHIGAFNYFDLTAQYRLKDRYTFRAGVDNIFDKQPPIIDSAACPNVVCSNNTFPQIYDPLGRYMFVGLTADF